MKKLLLVILPFALLGSLHGEDAAPVKTEVRELLPADLRDIRFDFQYGTLTVTSGKVQYTYQPNFNTVAERIAASEALLSELRHASKLLVTVEVPAGDHVYGQWFTVQFDSLR